MRRLRHLLLGVDLRDFVPSWDNLKRWTVVNKVFLTATWVAVKDLIAVYIPLAKWICRPFLGLAQSGIRRLTVVFRRITDALIDLIILFLIFLASHWIAENANRILGLGLPLERITLLVELLVMYVSARADVLKKST